MSNIQVGDTVISNEKPTRGNTRGLIGVVRFLQPSSNAQNPAAAVEFIDVPPERADEYDLHRCTGKISSGLGRWIFVGELEAASQTYQDNSGTLEYYQKLTEIDL